MNTETLAYQKVGIYPQIIPVRKTHTTYLKNHYQPGDRTRWPIKLLKTDIYSDFADRNKKEWKSLPDFTQEILNNLNGSLVPFNQAELNSRRLRALSKTHIKVQTPKYIAWVHKSDRYISMESILCSLNDRDMHLGSRYFYDPTIHRDAYKGEMAIRYRQIESLEMQDRMKRVVDEVFSLYSADETSSDECSDSCSFLQCFKKGLYQMAEAISVFFLQFSPAFNQ